MTQAISQDPVFMEMAKEMQEAMLTQNMGAMDLNGGAAAGEEAAAQRGAPGMPPVDPAKYMQVGGVEGGGCGRVGVAAKPGRHLATALPVLSAQELLFHWLPAPSCPLAAVPGACRAWCDFLTLRIPSPVPFRRPCSA